MSPQRPSGDPALAKVAERQMRNWELARTQRLTVPETQRKEVEDFVCVSRSVGAGGNEVASTLGERLGWPVFDKEILDLMAGDNELRRQVYASMDERDLSWCEETLRLLIQPEFVKNDYFHRLTETVLSLARQGHGVFLGRGTDLILPKGVGFRVRLVAPPEQCAQRFARRLALTGEQAREEINRLEQERAEFIRHHFAIDPGEPTRYDLIINLAQFSPTQVVELILAARQAAGIGL